MKFNSVYLGSSFRKRFRSEFSRRVIAQLIKIFCVLAISRTVERIETTTKDPFTLVIK